MAKHVSEVEAKMAKWRKSHTKLRESRGHRQAEVEALKKAHEAEIATIRKAHVDELHEVILERDAVLEEPMDEWQAEEEARWEQVANVDLWGKTSNNETEAPMNPEVYKLIKKKSKLQRQASS